MITFAVERPDERWCSPVQHGLTYLFFHAVFHLPEIAVFEAPKKLTHVGQQWPLQAGYVRKLRNAKIRHPLMNEVDD